MQPFCIRVPVSSSQPLAPGDHAALDHLGLDTEFLTELVLTQWDQFMGFRGDDLHGVREDHAYESVIEVLAEATLNPGDYSDVSGDGRALYLANHADELVQSACKIHNAFYPYLRTMPCIETHKQLESVTVDRFGQDYTLVKFNFADDEIPTHPQVDFR